MQYACTIYYVYDIPEPGFLRRSIGVLGGSSMFLYAYIYIYTHTLMYSCIPRSTISPMARFKPVFQALHTC